MNLKNTFDLTEAVGDYQLNQEENNMSKFGNLNWQDLIRGLIVAVLSAVLTYLLQVFQGGEFSFTALWVIAGIAFCSYMLKNLGTTQEGKFLGIV